MDETGGRQYGCGGDEDADWLMDEKQVQRFRLENKSNLISSFKETAATKKKRSVFNFIPDFNRNKKLSDIANSYFQNKIKKNVYMLKKNPQGSW